MRMRDNPTQIEIDLAAIRYNINQIKKRVEPAQVMAVVKADGYGHGMVEVAETALKTGVSCFGVARLSEGIELRENGIEAPVLVFGGFFENQISSFLEYDLQFTLYDPALLSPLSDSAVAMEKNAEVHVKIDTGMGRVGVDWRHAADFIGRVAESDKIALAGVYTHFAASDEKDKTFAGTQLQRFREVLAQLEEREIAIPLRHAANSGAVMDIPEAYFDLVRPGVSIYGYYPSQETWEPLELRPAMTVRSHVIAVRDADAGATVSYGMTYTTSGKTRLATIPVGYGDGYNRLLSNRGEVLIRGKRLPIAGRVTMDQIVVDVGASSEIRVGDEVVLLGSQGNDKIGIWEICEKVDTIPYEVTCALSGRLPRIFNNEIN